MVEIIHLVPGKLVYGAGSMVDELHFAINKHYAERAKQSIISLSDPFNADEAVSVENLYQHINKTYSNPVVFMHKIARTDCEQASQQLLGNVPFNIINHTQTTKPFGLSRCDNLICVSNHMVKSLKKHAKGSKICMIRNGVNACRFDAIDPLVEEQREGYFVSGRLNNFNSTKHPPTWLKWLNDSPLGGISHWHDYLGGGQKFEQSRKFAANAARLSFKQRYKIKLNLPGRINDFATKASYIKSWDIFLYEIPGEEGTSMSMLEALACGKPALINNKPGNSECIFKWKNGFVCENRKIMYDRMSYLAKNPNALANLKESTKEYYLENLDAKYMAKEYVQLAESMV